MPALCWPLPLRVEETEAARVSSSLINQALRWACQPAAVQAQLQCPLLEAISRGSADPVAAAALGAGMVPVVA